MKRVILFISTMVLLGTFGLLSQALAQPAPPPPPPAPGAPGAGPVYTPPPPPPAAAPLPARCGVYPAPPCSRPYGPMRRPWRSRFWRLGPYIGLGGGGFGVTGAKGPYGSISSGGFGNLYVGMNFTRRFALELGFIGSAHNERFTGDPNALFLWGVTLDAKFNLVRPSWRHRLVPYLQVGGGAYGLYSDSYWGTSDLARGGGFQAGAGLDLYLTRWLTLGARLLYRGIVMGKLNTTCDGECISRDEADRTYLNGVTGEVNMAIVF